MRSARLTPSYEDIAKYVDWDAVKDFRKRSLNPERPVQRHRAESIYTSESRSRE